MLAYVYYTSTDESSVDRCVALLEQAHGSPLVQKYASAVPQYPGLFGCPVGAGPEAPSNNPGIAAVEGLRSSIVAGEHPNLTSAERAEVLAFYEAAIPLQDDWYWNDGT